MYNPEGTLTLEMLLPGISITPSEHILTHADGELRIDASTDPPTYSGKSTTQPWSVNWVTQSVSSSGLAGGPWFFGDGSTAPGGTRIDGSKNIGDLTYSVSFVRN